MRGFVEDKHKLMLKAVRNEMETKVLIEVREQLQVPGLIGDNSPFSTLSNFLLTSHAKSEAEISSQRTNVAAMLARIDRLESLERDSVREKDNLNIELKEKFQNVERDNGRLRVQINNVSKKLDQVEKDSKPFTKEEIT